MTTYSKDGCIILPDNIFLAYKSQVRPKTFIIIQKRKESPFFEDVLKELRKLFGGNI